MLAIGLSSAFMVVEVVGGYLANSIAIYSDAAHLLTDIAGFGIALLAAIAAKAPGTKTLTFGFARAEVFGALGSVMSLWVITVFLLYAAYFRAEKWFKGDPEPVNGALMFAVACFGVCVNLCLGWVFSDEHGGAFHPGHSHEHGHCAHSQPASAAAPAAAPQDHGHDHGHDDHHDHAHGHHDHSACDHGKEDVEAGGHDHGHGHAHEKSPLLTAQKSYQGCDHDAPAAASAHDHHDGHSHGHSHNVSDVNIEAAYLHVLTDLIQSVGVALAGLIMWHFPHFEIIDPLCTLIFSAIALYSTLPLIHRVSVILFEGAPSHIDWEIVMQRFSDIPGVENVHDLHIWSISSKSISLTCHIRASNPQAVLRAAHGVCRGLGIDHATIQVHDASDQAFCYSQTCDWEHSVDVEEAVVAARNTQCMTARA